MIILSDISMDPYFSEVSLYIVRVASCQEVTSQAEVLHIHQYCILLRSWYSSVDSLTGISCSRLNRHTYKNILVREYAD